MTVRSTRGRLSSAAAVLVVGVGGLTACSDPAGPETGAITSEDLQNLQEQVGGLEDRIGALETADRPGDPTDDTAPGGEPVPGAETGPLFTDPASLIGQQVTVRAPVMEVLATTESGAALTIGGQGEDEAVTVLAPEQPLQVGPDDVVEVTGMVVQVSRSSFEQDFGVRPDTLLTDPEAFFIDVEGDIAVDATQVRVLPGGTGPS